MAQGSLSDSFGNKNATTTITTGIELPTGTGTEQVIDIDKR